MPTETSPPKWVTPAGSLGIIPELEYFQLSLDAHDPNGGTLQYSLVSGSLPLGLQIASTSFIGIQGVPVSELLGDVSVEYKFTVRVKNLSTNFLADRTFSLIVTNVAPPLIAPKDLNLGVFFDGTEVSLQLQAIEFTPGAELTWSLIDGELPDGLTLASSGLITGYVNPILAPGPNKDPDWDKTGWDSFNWDFYFQALRKAFEFTVQVYDGVNYDRGFYRLEVFPKSFLTADNHNSYFRVSLENLSYAPVIFSQQNSTVVDLLGPEITVDMGNLHNPIILTTQDDFASARQSTYYAFKIDALDLDFDEIQYYITSYGASVFDGEQINNEYPYIDAQSIDGLLYQGVWPKVTSTNIGGDEILSTDPSQPNYIPGDIIKILDNHNLWRLATVTNTSIVRVVGNERITANVGNYITQFMGGANATISNISSTTGTMTFSSPVTVTIGSIINQSGNTSVASANVYLSSSVPVTATLGRFTEGSGNVTINGNIANVYPTSVDFQTDITASYNNVATFGLSGSNIADIVFINGISTSSYANSIIALGVSLLLTLADESEIGFDEDGVKFDQSIIGLPDTLSLNLNSGWITGRTPVQTLNSVRYQFEVTVKKKSDHTYQTNKLFSLVIEGDLFNYVEWITPADLGTIQNGEISDLYVEAFNSKGVPLFYTLTSSHRMPQGLHLTPGGLISGRASFRLFDLDQGTTTIDGNKTTFDRVYRFTVTATDGNNRFAADRTFILTVIERNMAPFENLYLQALAKSEQRDLFFGLIQNKQIFPPEFIYRTEDPFFGMPQTIRTLFLPGLTPHTLAEYTTAAELNHFTKRLIFGEVKTASVLDKNFEVKYEVVYIELQDLNSDYLGQGPESVIDLTSIIKNPYSDTAGNAYTIAYPNAFSNMKDQMVTEIGYTNKGALPDWMTSNQPTGDGKFTPPLGFVRAVVLAYTIPDTAKTIAFRFKQADVKLNQINFTVDRYQLDNILSDTYDSVADKFISGEETTFDRYSGLSSVFVIAASVDYAVSVSLDSIHGKTVHDIAATGAMDSSTTFKDGDTIVFFNQEFFLDQNDTGSYNQGWNYPVSIWSGEPWEQGSLTVDPDDDITWDEAGYVSGYNEHILDAGLPSTTIGFPLAPVDGQLFVFDGAIRVYNLVDLVWRVPNERIGIWQITVNPSTTVTLTFVKDVEYYDRIYVRDGATYGRQNIYYDPIAKEGRIIPNYTVLDQTITVDYTIFDGNGTRFFDNRDGYTPPGAGDKYIKFTKTSVFS